MGIIFKMQLLTLLALITITINVELPLSLGKNICAALMSSFDPILVDIKLPAVQGFVKDQTFKISVTQLTTQEVVYERAAAPNATIRDSLTLEQNILHEICVSYESTRDFVQEDEQIVYVGFTQTQDFQSLIGHVEIPPELAKEENLKEIYVTANKLDELAQVVAKHQNRQRQLQDEIVVRDLHKSQRVITLGLIECLVIILSGVYQVCALRKFLIQKNLY